MGGWVDGNAPLTCVDAIGLEDVDAVQMYSRLFKSLLCVS